MVRWPAVSAVLAYDAQIVASGITTVFDSLRAGLEDRRDAVTGSLEISLLRSMRPGARISFAPSISPICAAKFVRPT